MNQTFPPVAAPPLPRPPIPRPPTAPISVGTVVDVVTGAAGHGWGWTARVLATGEQVSQVHERKRVDTVVDRMAGEIGDWLRAIDSAGPITVRCFTAILRTALIPRLDPERFAIVDGLALGPAAGWAEQAKTELSQCLAEQEERLRRARVLYAASDGASHPAYGNGAYAWVTQFGQYQVGRASRSITMAEFTGIVQFAKQVPFETFGKAVLFVDSLQAIRAIQNKRSLLWRLPDQQAVLQTLSMVEGGRLELVWVRGHNGHALNDVADRLALMRHRAVRMDMGEAQIAESAQHIIDQERDTLLRTSWSRSRANALRAWRDLEEANGGDWSGQ